MADHLFKLNHPLHKNAIKQGSSLYWLPACTQTADAKIGFIGVNEKQEIVFVPKVSDLKAAIKDRNTRTGSIQSDMMPSFATATTSAPGSKQAVENDTNESPKEWRMTIIARKMFVNTRRAEGGSSGYDGFNAYGLDAF